MGDMPLLDYYVKDKKLPEFTEVDDLVKHRYEWNQATFDSLKFSDCEDEMLEAAQDEAETGWTWPHQGRFRSRTGCATTGRGGSEFGSGVSI